MAFPTTNLSLKAVCDAYGVASNMGALRGKKYYSWEGAEAIIPASGSFNLGNFRGNYNISPVKTYFFRNTYSNPDIPVINVPFISNGIQLGSCNFGTLYNDTYTITNGILTSLNITIFSQTWNTDSSGNITTFNDKFPNEDFKFYINNIETNNFNYTFKDSTSVQYKIDINITATSSIQFSIFRYSSNFQTAWFLTIIYGVTPTGLVLSSTYGSTMGNYVQ